MSDLISRQAAIDALKRHRSLFCEKRVDFLMLSEKDKARVDEIDTCISELLNLQTVQPERKKGKWMVEGYDATCSVCKTIYCGEWYDLDLIVDCQYNFCPNCGAEMGSE